MNSKLVVRHRDTTDDEVLVQVKHAHGAGRWRVRILLVLVH